MIKKLTGLFDEGRSELKKIDKIAKEVDALDAKMQALSDEELKAKTEEFKGRLDAGETLDDILPEAFATIREAAFRVTGMKPFYVQILGALALHRGDIAEMKTGEGKTLTSTMPAYLNALSGKGVHIVTVNEYLAGRDAREMGEIFSWLGLTVGLNLNELNAEQKQAAYNCDITYTTNNELGFDYLRDNMVLYGKDKVQRPLNYAIIDEVDSILVDEARTPLIISGGKKQTAPLYMSADAFAKGLKEEQDYLVDIESKTVQLTPEGVAKAESVFKIDNLFDLENTELVHRIQQALRANYIMGRDVEYVVQKGEILIVDQFTGRIMPGRAYSDGLHQAIEAKESVEIREETVTLATITFQNFFRLYEKLSGMTGTAKTEEEEFLNTYNMRVIEIPTNKPVIRDDSVDYIYGTLDAKFNALADDVAQRHEAGQPVLIGTVAVETSEHISQLLKNRNIPHEILNAKNHSREAEIIAKAGEKGSVTLATNMAGRGTDIKLGEGVAELGGLAVLGSERHESRRIDNQLRGRSGRQGDPGYSRFYISLEDELMRRFGGDRVQRLLNGALGDEALESKTISKQVESSQKRVEGVNYDIRKQLMDYDDVLRRQREIMYAQRDMILYAEEINELIHKMITATAKNLCLKYDLIGKTDDKFDFEPLVTDLNKTFFGREYVTIDEAKKNCTDGEKAAAWIEAQFNKFYADKQEQTDTTAFNEFQKVIALRVIDEYWMAHIDAMSHLRDGIHLRSYAQQNPVHAYQEEGFRMFEQLNANIALQTTLYVMRAQIVDHLKREEAVKGQSAQRGGAKSELKAEKDAPSVTEESMVETDETNFEKPISRNQPCPCGSGKKYKHCHGKNE